MGSNKMWEKYGALGGIWFAVLVIVGGLLGGRPALRSDSSAEIAKWYADNDSAIQVGGFLGAIGIIGLIWWFGSLWEAVRKAEDSRRLSLITLVGFLISGIGAIGAFSVSAGTAAAIDQVGEAAVVFNHISSIFLSFSSIGYAIMVMAISALAFRTGFLPKWIAQGGLIVVLVSLIGSAGIATDAGAFAAFSFASFALWVAWIVSISVHLFQNSSRT